jgi:hypothetical protein
MKRLLVIAFLAVGCGSNSTGGTPPGQGSGGNGGQGGAGGAWPGAAVCAGGQATSPIADVSGKWAYLEIQSSIVRAPAYPQPFSNLVISLMLLAQTQSGTQVTGQATFCDRYTFCPDAPTALPDSFVPHMPVLSYQGSYGADGSFAFGPTYMVQGATLADPTDSTSLPTTIDDPRVSDQDQDGNPGVTIVLIRPVAGKMYVVQWSWIKPHGASVAPDRIRGLLDYDSKQNVLESDPALIKQMSPTTSVDTEPCHSTFQMLRVPADADCATLKAQELTLFPELAAVPRTNP